MNSNITIIFNKQFYNQYFIQILRLYGYLFLFKINSYRRKKKWRRKKTFGKGKKKKKKKQFETLL